MRENIVGDHTIFPTLDTLLDYPSLSFPIDRQWVATASVIGHRWCILALDILLVYFK